VNSLGVCPGVLDFFLLEAPTADDGRCPFERLLECFFILGVEKLLFGNMFMDRRLFFRGVLDVGVLDRLDFCIRGVP
jgi:hypothetical protein